MPLAIYATILTSAVRLPSRLTEGRRRVGSLASYVGVAMPVSCNL